MGAAATLRPAPFRLGCLRGSEPRVGRAAPGSVSEPQGLSEARATAGTPRPRGTVAGTRGQSSGNSVGVQLDTALQDTELRLDGKTWWRKTT